MQLAESLPGLVEEWMATLREYGAGAPKSEHRFSWGPRGNQQGVIPWLDVLRLANGHFPFQTEDRARLVHGDLWCQSESQLARWPLEPWQTVYDCVSSYLYSRDLLNHEKEIGMHMVSCTDEVHGCPRVSTGVHGCPRWHMC